MIRFDTLVSMDTACSRPAYAKVNLHLAIGLPYPDGYHPIQSIFALVDLSDIITMSWEERDVFDVQVEGLESYCSDASDTLTKAALLWHQAGGFGLGLHVRCEKRIPVKAGLGGGSSDAAALLMMLQAIDPSRALTDEALKRVALQVGSDVPFFLGGFKSALVGGRGEYVTPLDGRSMPALLVMPTFFDVSTSSAFRLLDEFRGSEKAVSLMRREELMQIYKKPSKNWKGSLYNDFMPCSSNRDFYERLNALCEGHAGFGSMSGSGACWFFVSEDASLVHTVHANVVAAFGQSVRCWVTHLMG